MKEGIQAPRQGEVAGAAGHDVSALKQLIVS
jgi:hypothetical protein